MKIKPIQKSLLICVATASIVVVGLAQQRKPNATNATQAAYAMLASYPKDFYFPKVIESHQKWIASPKDKAILKATWFSGDTGVQMSCYVDQKGLVTDVRKSVGLSNWPRRLFPLSKQQFQVLRTKLKALPGNAAKPEIMYLLILSFSTGNSRETRLYDRASLPQEIQDVFQIMRLTITSPEA